MQTKILDLTKDKPQGDAVQTVLTFRPFIDFLKKRRDATEGVKNGYINYVIEQFEQKPELLDKIDVNDAYRYGDEFQLIYNTLSPIVEDENKHYWSLSLPLSPVLFYSTNAFFNLIADITSCSIRKEVLQSKEIADIVTNQLKFRYSLILEKCYGIPSFFNREIIHSMADAKTGMNRFYKMKMDIRFIDVHTVKPLPDINIESLKSRTSYDHQDVLPLLQRILPLDMFRFEGFGLTQIADITSQYAIENIKNAILNTYDMDEEQCFDTITRSLKALVGNNEIEFGVLPVLRINNKLVFDKSMCSNSMVIGITHEQGLGEETYLALAQKYLDEPKVIFYKEITKADENRKGYLRLLKKSGVKSYALLPVYFNKSLGGVLEVYSKKEGILDDVAMTNLDVAMPLLSQLLNNAVHQFEDGIEHVIKEKFTSVQPAVQWKFNEAAWHYMRDKHSGSANTEVEDIEFKAVYPLYGAVDIRNSTIERNASLSRDLQVQFGLLIEVLKELKERSGFGLIDEKIYLTQKWLEKVSEPDGFYEEVRLNEFLENNIVPFLLHFQKGNPVYEKISARYFEAIDEASGIANYNRRSLESSMTTVISAVNFYLESMKGEIQQAYPSYFEKFRTDGVEYDIYIGQSIAPDKPFSDIYLKNLRLLQVSSMAAIAKYAHSLIDSLPVPVETTQLIFVHSNPIDIKFRKDEKRFDVEGAYNIRYHIVKKRIDKIHIKSSAERLTQPDKIAIVYFTRQEADEYRGYINYLQEQGLLKNDLEDLELEEMQGVNGLRALRVGVVI
ncbi:GAF domain-containing protein [Ferruginibacter sp. HRS2-29]|uniref:GAF domain-containing protein n=1 Tax=Ferruginibacter sp. HRS2-29 TaxID=2487334 RepID=UPI0020CF8BDA|nr:GAF domain-containing protein [Ferruginibacter sp. HRS2-29]MCP9749792.1 GAF domain-containing protein [Ferruginibacter sp. HRS2-29]